MAAIDWHTSEMAKHQEMAKENQHMQREFNNHLYKLPQEMEYQQVAEVGESSDEGSTGEETSDRETDEDAEGEEAPESDPEGCHKMKTKSQGAIPLSSTKPMRYSRGQQRGLEAPEKGDGGDMNRSLKYQEGTEVKSQRLGNQRTGGWQQVPVRAVGCQRRLELLFWLLRAEEVQDKNAGGRLEQDNKGDVEEWKVGFHKLPKGVNRESRVFSKPESEDWTRTKSASSHTSWKRKSLGRAELEWKKWKVVGTPEWGSKVAMKSSPGGMTKHWDK
ncbi:hypothetical protein EDC04DRAFT_2602364 [Pisolithus marmoratus]|nr:hypothetical protein EDC04DRAFT_2602364 [Pisolithus marmoratus]